MGHLNSVLKTVCDIVESEVKEKKIKEVKFEGAGDEKDTNEFYEANIRAKIYMRFLNNRYGINKVENIGRYIKVDMTKVYPEVFENIPKKNRMDLIVDELVRISDEYPNREGIMRGVDGVNDKQFNISTDFIVNSDYGSLNVEIDVWEDANEFNITWDKMDINEEGSEYFSNFSELLNFIKGFK